ncbi:hypothetical protein SNE40_022741 [Patella caerulea]|uniref:UDENN domain-containing protein n=1 Tax=Patella caerulea TaxID=87958 RepID=A0AAN8J402_PATCE
MADECKNEDSHVLHVVVVGFHHKKGCQVEYSYPPLIPGNKVDSHDVPKEWKHLPSLALPDGAHNFQKDTVFFHLPGRNGSNKTVYGVSCYRQMDAKDLKNKDSEVTRSTIQKSVCVLSRLPLYGMIKAKLELITHAYFDERDFSKVELLEQTYNNMKLSLSETMLDGAQVYLGLSPREIVLQFKHKIVLLFKLILLERRVLFYGAPVETLGGLILTLLSLFPGMVEYGLDEAVNKSSQKVSSSSLKMAGSDQDESDGYLEISYTETGSDSPLYTNVQSNLSGSRSHHSLDTEPESPTIPRDEIFTQHSPDSSDSLHHKKNKDNTDELSPSVHSYHSDKPKVKGKSNSSELKGQGHNSGISNQAKSAPVAIDNATKTEDTSSGSLPTSEIIFAKESSPLQDLYSITHVEAIQTAQDNELSSDHSQDQLDNYSSDKSLHQKKELSLSISPNPPVQTTMSLDIEDLDSPESISKIDREDCFSWEDDRLLLAINDDVETKATSDEMSDQQQGSRKVSKGNESEGSDSRPSSRQSSPGVRAAILKNKLSSAFGNLQSKSKVKSESSPVEMKPLYGGPELHQDECGFPLAIFTRGTVCHPYLSLQYHDILHDITIRSFVIGATNILFKQRKNLLDAIVEIEEGKIEIHDKELQKHLHLTTADLRFGEYIVKTVIEDKDDIYLDGTEWEGGDEWLRAQFRLYLQSLLATMMQDDVKLQEDFGLVFISAWKTTNNYRYWSSMSHPALHNIPTGHPFQGNLNMNDIRMRLSHTMQNTERGKKLNAAVVQTGKYMVETGKAVGGALNHAKSAVSSWFSSWRQEKPTTPPSDNTAISPTEEEAASSRKS